MLFPHIENNFKTFILVVWVACQLLYVVNNLNTQPFFRNSHSEAFLKVSGKYFLNLGELQPNHR